MNMDTGESGSFETREFSIRGRGRRKIVFQNNISLDLTVGYLIRDDLEKIHYVMLY